MKSSKPWLIGLACLIPFVMAGPVHADFYDLFTDGSYQEDPNVWDIDDPCWIPYVPLQGPNAVGVVNEELNLWTARGSFFQACAILAYPDDGDSDPNTSETTWGHTTDHYIIARTRNMAPQPDPNDDFGTSALVMHANLGNWFGFAFEWIYRRYGSDGHVLPRISSVQGLDWYVFQWQHVSYDDPCFPDEVGGFWMLFAYHSDGNTDPEDPNGKFLRAAFWDGDKYDWDGTWFLEVDLGEPNTWKDKDDILVGDWWQPVGKTTLGSVEYYDGETHVAFDEIEARTGTFDNAPKHLDLTIANSKYGLVQIDPELPDPNDTWDPNTLDPNDGTTFPTQRLLRYTTNTEVVLVAEPVVDRSFKNWTIFDPNYPGNRDYATLDSNAVLTLTMDMDYEVEAAFSCGSGLPPFVAMTLMALAVGMVIRRLL